MDIKTKEFKEMIEVSTGLDGKEVYFKLVDNAIEGIQFKITSDCGIELRLDGIYTDAFIESLEFAVKTLKEQNFEIQVKKAINPDKY